MSSVIDMRAEAIEGFVTGLCVGLAITFAIGAAAVVGAHFCIWPLAPWCGW